MRTSTFLFLTALILAVLINGQVPDLPLTPKHEADAAPAAGDVKPAGHELTAADVEAFLEGIIPQQLKREDIAGATVAVVKDGKLLFSKGYGYSDVANKKPVSPSETLFRPGSVSKLFTWTAVMQLAEQGKVDLDRDVNEYLDFKIPEQFGKPITLKNLMTHTPGFEEQVKDLFTIDTEPPDLARYVKSHSPKQIYPPGTVPAYSNYGTAVAGYIVERVSGRPFSEYIAENIFKPLGMTHSTFVQPLSPDLAPNMSNGYGRGSDEKAIPFEMVTAFPAGSLSSPAEDMARFIIAHLQDGQLGDARILRPETARLMHSRLFALDPAANAMAYGFYEETRNGHRIIGHAGDTTAFHSDLHLIQDAGVGFFVSYNSGGKGEISPRTLLWEAFLDRYFPYTLPPITVPSTAKQDVDSVSGTYTISRKSASSFLKVAAILGQATVSGLENGMIEVEQLNDPNGKPTRWQETAPLTFREIDGQNTLIFNRDGSGNLQMVLPYPFMVFQRTGFWENKRILIPVLIISLVIMLLTLVMAPVAWAVRKRYGYKLDLSPLERKLRIGIWIVFALDLIFVAAFIGLITYAMDHIEILSDSGNKWFYLIQTLGILGGIGTLVVLYNAIDSWISKRRIWNKLRAAVLVLACLGFLWFALAGNLLTMTSNY